MVHRIGARLGLFAASAMNDHVVVDNRHRFEILVRDMELEIAHYDRFQFGCNQFVVLQRPREAVPA